MLPVIARCPRVVKMDVEGFEAQVIAGARTLLARCGAYGYMLASSASTQHTHGWCCS